MESASIDKVHMPTMTELIENLKLKGFTSEFSVKESGQMTADGVQFYKPSQVKIIDFSRFEGESDPGDEAVLYALETDNGIKGLLSHIYGRENSEENSFSSHFIKEVMILHQDHPLSTGII